MKVIAFLNGKGGVGKTTLAINVAWCLSKLGFNVAVIDCDPQGSVINWASESCPFTIYPALTDREVYNVKKTVSRYKYDYVIIDGAAAISSISAAAVMVSDLVLIPVTASPLDFSASGAIIDVIDARRALTPIEARFVITKRVTNATMNKTLRDSIEATGFEAMRTSTAHRQSYVKCLIDGGSIFTGSDNQAKGEIEILTQEIMRLAA
ncbi:ParA family protein [Salmonella enterica]|nr:chromosome partitioning protein ParA [Salmonella enterica]EDX5289436.1 ParA family protein [Salmonella enterica subsp. enterica serovar Javiana]EBL1889437.1 chromosome partitioning protein ParA [Salmonella enterica]ECV2890816.1 ParA family protein [Salmonella enterica]EEJ8200207.1 ParA family protein [Salmonella enterica]